MPSLINSQDIHRCFLRQMFQQQELYQFALQTNTVRSSLNLYRSLHLGYEYAQYLSDVKSLVNRRLISRLRCGCHDVCT